MRIFFVPTIEQRKFLYKLSGINYKKYSRSVDGVILKTSSFEKIKSINDFLYIEIKTTKSKSVKNLPYGVFLVLPKTRKTYLKNLKIIDYVLYTLI